jgi:hypothetical protein
VWDVVQKTSVSELRCGSLSFCRSACFLSAPTASGAERVLVAAAAEQEDHVALWDLAARAALQTLRPPHRTGHPFQPFLSRYGR